MLCNHTLAYYHQYPVEQAPVAAGFHIDLDEEENEDEEEEDYVPSKEQVHRDPSPTIDSSPNWYQQYDERFSNFIEQVWFARGLAKVKHGGVW